MALTVLHGLDCLTIHSRAVVEAGAGGERRAGVCERVGADERAGEGHHAATCLGAAGGRVA